MRILFNAMNGLGIGHLSRVSALAEAMRLQWHEDDESLQLCLLTTSEATNALKNNLKLLVFKVPSRSIAEENGILYAEYLPLGRAIISEVTKFFSPDLMVVDTMPSGLFGELLPEAPENVRKYCKRLAVIARPVRQEILDRPTFGPALHQFDRILIPEDEHNCSLALPNTTQGQVCYCGPIFSVAPAEGLQRHEVRHRFGISPATRLVLLSVGGGGSAYAEKILHFIVETLADERNIHIIVLCGPLYRGSVYEHHHNVTWLRGERMVELLSGVDIAISTAGYNSFNELMFHGIPTVFIPLEAKLDDQTARALRGEHAGAARVLSELHAVKLREFIHEWEDPARRQRASQAAKNLVPANGLGTAAGELLSLLR